MASAAVIVPKIASAAGLGYLLLPETAKTGVSAGLNILGLGANTFATLPIIIVGCIINFILLAVIFTWTLYRREKALILSGLLVVANPLTDALWKGLGLAFVATVILLLVSILTGGLGILLMLGVWFFTILGVVLLSMTNISFLNDVNPQVGAPYTSGFKLFSIAFWPAFLAGMFIAIGIAIAVGVLGTKLTKAAADIAAPIAARMGSLGNLVAAQSMLD